MKKQPLVVLLLSLPVSAQTSLIVKSMPIYAHGELLPFVTDTPHNVNIVCRITESIRKRYLRVFVGVHNTAAAGNLDFDPSGITFIGTDGSQQRPMDASEVKNMAKSIARHQMLGVMGATMALDFSNSVANTNNKNMQVYQQMRTDDMSDAAFAGIGKNYVTTQKLNILHSTIFPGDKLEGFVYFDLGKNGAVADSYTGYILNVPIEGRIYEMDFKDNPGSAQAQYISSSQTPTQSPIPPAPSANPVSASMPVQEQHSTLLITSAPVGAEIDLDGNFIGDTPSQIHLPAGDHTITLNKDGYLPWTKKLRVMDGSLSLNADMKPLQPTVYRVK